MFLTFNIWSANMYSYLFYSDSFDYFSVSVSLEILLYKESLSILLNINTLYKNLNRCNSICKTSIWKDTKKQVDVIIENP
jgi:hypothetical protein